MAKICFKPKRFGPDRIDMIDTVNGIIEEYAEKGYKLTLRQLYYQLVGHDLFPDDRRFTMNRQGKWVRSDAADATKNAFPNYKWLGEIVTDGRDAGLIDWEAIEDRGRVPYLPAAWSSPADIVTAAYQQFRVDRWQGQENYVEVMVEKDALSNVMLPVCSRFHVRFTANKGYSSATAMFDTGERIRERLLGITGDGSARTAHLIYFGDHDPSGMDMTDDIRKRIIQYCRLEDVEDQVEFHRVALNMDQVQRWNPPPNPMKEKDSRSGAYKKKFGRLSWELDAVEVTTLADLLETQIWNLIDSDTWNQVMAEEKKMKNALKAFADDWKNRDE